MVFLAAAAQRTRTMRLVTGAVLPVFNNPLKLAGELGMLDSISNGRLDIGVARAFLPHEFAAFGISMDESRARFDEGFAALQVLLGQEQASFEGQFHRFSNVTSLPRPVQQPHPPVWVATSGTPETIRWIAQKGFPMIEGAVFFGFSTIQERHNMYREAARAAGHSEERIEWALANSPQSTRTVIAETREKALEDAKPAVMWFYNSLLGHTVRSGVEKQDPQQFKHQREQMRQRADMSYEEIVERELIGDPEYVARRIQEFQDVGVKYFILWTTFGGLEKAKALRTLEMFAKHVMPHFREEEAHSTSRV